MLVSRASGTQSNTRSSHLCPPLCRTSTASNRGPAFERGRKSFYDLACTQIPRSFFFFFFANLQCFSVTLVASADREGYGEERNSTLFSFNYNFARGEGPGCPSARYRAQMTRSSRAQSYRIALVAKNTRIIAGKMQLCYYKVLLIRYLKYTRCVQK